MNVAAADGRYVFFLAHMLLLKHLGRSAAMAVAESISLATGSTEVAMFKWSVLCTC